MGSKGILLVIDDSICVCICKIYSSVFKEYTHYSMAVIFKYCRGMNFVVQSLKLDHIHPCV